MTPSIEPIVPKAGLQRAASLTAALAATLLLAATPAQAQKAYPSPEAASEALVDAVRRNDTQALRTVLGPDYKRYVPADVEKEDLDAFLAAWDKEHKTYTESGGAAMLSVGEQGWTLPIPIVKGKAGWHFDLKGAAEELRTRRIGRNELAAMQAALAYFDAQRDYSAVDRDGNGFLEYAQQFVSSPGKKDGLYWNDPSGTDPSPLGPLFAGKKPQGQGYHGYHFKILKGQGKDAEGGAFSYVLNGRMRAGFALVSWPVRYGDTGVMSFIVNHQGTVYEKDLGPNTDSAARAMTLFNPDPSWKKAAVPGL